MCNHGSAVKTNGQNVKCYSICCELLPVMRYYVTSTIDVWVLVCYSRVRLKTICPQWILVKPQMYYLYYFNFCVLQFCGNFLENNWYHCKLLRGFPGNVRMVWLTLQRNGNSIKVSIFPYPQKSLQPAHDTHDQTDLVRRPRCKNVHPLLSSLWAMCMHPVTSTITRCATTNPMLGKKKTLC